MTMRNIGRRWSALIESLVDAAATQQGHLVVIGGLTAYVAVWLVYAIVAKGAQGIHPDMGEIFAWGWQLEWGTPKHPPLLPALVSLWFSLFPAADWAYYLLAVICSAVAIYFTWLLAGIWLNGAKRAAVPFLMMLIPFYNFLALKLDHNAILVPLWAITTYAFVKSFQTRSALWSLLTGLFAGLSVLSKYWSFFLLLGLASAALADSRRLGYLKSSAPWIITIVSFGLFLPHILWLEANDYPTFVAARHQLADSTADMAWHLRGYVLNSIAYIVVPLLAVGVLARSSRAALKDMILPHDQERRFAAIMFWVPLLSAIPFAIVMQLRLSALWSMSALSLVSVVLLSSPFVHFNRKSAVAVAHTAFVLCISAVILSPIIAIWKLQGGVENQAIYTRPLAKEVQRLWPETTSHPLQIVESEYSLANSVAFYLEGRVLPVSFNARTHPWWDRPDTMDHFGTALICPALNSTCRAAMQDVMASRNVAKQFEVTLQPRWQGFVGDSRTFVVGFVVPKSENRAEEEFCCFSSARRVKAASDHDEHSRRNE